jgi:hypothetical protein
MKKIMDMTPTTKAPPDDRDMSVKVSTLTMVADFTTRTKMLKSC